MICRSRRLRLDPDGPSIAYFSSTMRRNSSNDRLAGRATVADISRLPCRKGLNSNEPIADDSPFAAYSRGTKQSGWGRENGVEVLRNDIEFKTVTAKLPLSRDTESPRGDARQWTLRRRSSCGNARSKASPDEMVVM